MVEMKIEDLSFSNLSKMDKLKLVPEIERLYNELEKIEEEVWDAFEKDDKKPDSHKQDFWDYCDRELKKEELIIKKKKLKEIL